MSNFIHIIGSCRPRDSVCDGIISTGCPEDDEWSTGAGFKCLRNGRTCKLPQQLIYDNVEDCERGDDICFFHNNDDGIFVDSGMYGDKIMYVFYLLGVF